MSTNYIPAQDSLLDTWAANFSALITATPATYGLGAGDATNISNVVTPWHTAYLAAINPSTRTHTTVQAKNTARTNMLAVLRPYSQQVANNAGVSSANKIALGLNPRTSTPTPVPTPVTYPVLSIPSLLPSGLVLRYRDELASPTVKAKPPGAISMELHGIAMGSGTPTISIDLAPIIATATKSPLIVDTTSYTRGQTLWLGGRWVTRTGLKGPFSTLINAVVP